MALDFDKLIVSYTDTTLGQWMNCIHGAGAFTIETPVKLFVSFQYTKQKDLNRANLTNYIKETSATLVYEKIVKHSQQFVEVSVEKKIGPRTEINLFLCQG